MTQRMDSISESGSAARPPGSRRDGASPLTQDGQAVADHIAPDREMHRRSNCTTTTAAPCVATAPVVGVDGLEPPTPAL